MCPPHRVVKIGNVNVKRAWPEGLPFKPSCTTDKSRARGLYGLLVAYGPNWLYVDDDFRPSEPMTAMEMAIDLVGDMYGVAFGPEAFLGRSNWFVGWVEHPEMYVVVTTVFVDVTYSVVTEVYFLYDGKLVRAVDRGTYDDPLGDLPALVVKVVGRDDGRVAALRTAAATNGPLYMATVVEKEVTTWDRKALKKMSRLDGS